MDKKRASAEVIQAEMQSWIAESDDLGGTCRGCEAPLPIPLATPRDGCNWTAGYVKVMPGCQRFMDAIIARAKRTYDVG